MKPAAAAAVSAFSAVPEEADKIAMNLPSARSWMAFHINDSFAGKHDHVLIACVVSIEM